MNDYVCGVIDRSAQTNIPVVDEKMKSEIDWTLKQGVRTFLLTATEGSQHVMKYLIRQKQLHFLKYRDMKIQYIVPYIGYRPKNGKLIPDYALNIYAITIFSQVPKTEIMQDVFDKITEDSTLQLVLE